MANLEKEMETYQREFPQLADQAGKFALVSGSELMGTWSTFDDALQEGYRVCGLSRRFMVKKIELTEQIHLISRMVEPLCHH